MDQDNMLELISVLEQIRDELCIMNVPQELRSDQRTYMITKYLAQATHRSRIRAIQSIGLEKQKYPKESDEKFNNLPEIIKLKNEIKEYEKDITKYEEMCKKYEALGCHSY